MILTLGLGLAIGLPFGWFAQRGRFCMNSAFQDILISKDSTLLRVYLLAVLVQLLVVNLLDLAGVITIRVPPFFWLAAIVGGVIFGVGMVLAAGCSTSTWLRAGEGMIGSWGALIAFAIGVAATERGILRFLKEPLRLVVAGPDVNPATLPHLVGGNRWLWIGTIAAILGAVVWTGLRRSELNGARWAWTGLILGGLATLAWLASSATGRRFGISIVQPTESIYNLFLQGNLSGLNWGSYMVVGLPLGAAAAALVYKEFQWRAGPPRRLLQQFGGGLLMGFGGSTAGGCNIGHGLTGVPILAATSWAAILFIFLGASATSYFLFMRE